MSESSTFPDPVEITCTTELTEPERLLIWSFRRWASGSEHWPVVRHTLARQFGSRQGAITLEAFSHFMDVLRVGARRIINYHMPCCPCIGADELRVLVIVASAQHGDNWSAMAVAGGLVQHGWIGPFVDAAEVLAETFRQNAAILRLKEEFFSVVRPELGIAEGSRMLN